MNILTDMFGGSNIFHFSSLEIKKVQNLFSELRNEIDNSF